MHPRIALASRIRVQQLGTIRREVAVEARIVPFGHQHIPAAASLLAETGKGHELATADPAVACQRIEEWAARQPTGFAALDGVSGRLAGFMAVSPSGGRGARVRLDQHATVGGELGHRVRCALYAALSAQLVGDGLLVHEANVLAADEGVVTSFARLGFGIDQVKGFRPAAPAAWDPRVRRALPEDIPRLVELAEEVQEFHARPPMWRQPQPGVSEVVERGYRRALEGGPAGLHLLVVAGIPGSRLIGLMQAAPDGQFTGAVTIGLAGVTQRFRSTGVGTALLTAVTDWSAGLGFTRCGAGWTSANPVSDRFWRSRGLVPQAYRMSRVIDHRAPAVL
jgi:GNAT superfamily N-acetyltransferase